MCASQLLMRKLLLAGQHVCDHVLVQDHMSKGCVGGPERASRRTSCVFCRWRGYVFKPLTVSDQAMQSAHRKRLCVFFYWWTETVPSAWRLRQLIREMEQHFLGLSTHVQNL